MPAPAIKDDLLYVVKMKKAVKDGRTMLLPNTRVVLKGSKLKELQAFVESYELK